MSNLGLFIGLPIGILGFLFLFWRRLKEDYPSNQIFSFAFTILAFLLLGFFIGLSAHTIKDTSYFTPRGLWFWGLFILGAVGFALANLKFKLRFFETLEAGGLGFIFLVSALYLTNLIHPFDIKLFIFSLLTVLLLPTFFFLDNKYKTFSWYKSGKIGFAGLAILGTFFLMRCLVALLNPSMISFIGKVDAMADVLVAFTFFFTLFNLSGN